MKNYLSAETGFPISYEHHKSDRLALIPILVDKWNEALVECGGDGSATNHSKIFMAKIKDFEWSFYEVLYNLQLQRSLGPLGGCVVERPEENAMAVIHDIIIQWIDADMIPDEASLYIHSLAMEVALDMYFVGDKECHEE